jgi:hypothetical protein
MPDVVRRTLTMPVRTRLLMAPLLNDLFSSVMKLFTLLECCMAQGVLKTRLRNGYAFKYVMEPVWADPGY